MERSRKAGERETAMNDTPEVKNDNPEAQNPLVLSDIAYYDGDIRISNEEWFEISSSLEKFHSVFNTLWQMGKPVFSLNIDTAAVQWDENGEVIWFHFNPYFWQRINSYKKLFVICHECLHVILNHGIRTVGLQNNKFNMMAANSALDVVVNHMLLKVFGFQRDKITDEDSLCWVDTVFAHKNPLPPDDETFEFYYNLFEKFYLKGIPGDGEDCPFGTLDDHSLMNQDAGKIIDELNNSLTDDEKEALKDLVEKHFQKSENKEDQKGGNAAGQGTGGEWSFIKKKKIVKKKKWETIIVKWAKKYLQYKDIDEEQWARVSRRLALIPQNKIFLPCDQEVEVRTKDENRIKVFFFLDTSGSCWGLKDRFFNAAESLPPEKFDIRLFCFDDKVVETTLESRQVYGNGGTSFCCIEKAIQQEIAKTQEGYPAGVFVITDGYAYDKVKPEKPENWHVILTEGGSKSCMSSESHFFALKDFE
jgi:hypothetical protein